MYEVVPAAAQDLIAIRALLQRSGLPTSDLDSARPDFMLIRENDCVIAAGALQRFGSSALLRSVVVAPEHRERGLGRAMVSELERLARTAHVNQFVLLTQSAAEFFARQGYRVIERSRAPHEVQSSEEFRSLCPSSATCMAKSLTNAA
ncbi:MAG TPA: arsenic resistance N-acetyltransferase ArsN2 [Terriglobales bacterium]|nr:arsenic resistance N-acetyltransferase ArsN2 [Terriglobales bacterium]